MSNAQKDWEADLETESREDLIKAVKHFQSVALGTYDPEKEEERYTLGVAVDRFTSAAATTMAGGVVEYKHPEQGWTVIDLPEFILGWGERYNNDNIRLNDSCTE